MSNLENNQATKVEQCLLKAGAAMLRPKMNSKLESHKKQACETYLPIVNQNL